MSREAAAKNLLIMLESFRREPKNAEKYPIDASLLDELRKITRQEDALSDFATYLNLISAGKTALEESLENGQQARSSLGMKALEMGAQGLKTWMMIRGYFPLERDLSLLTDPSPSRVAENISLNPRVFAKGDDSGEIIETSEAKVLPDSTLSVKAVRLLSETATEKTYRIVEVNYTVEETHSLDFLVWNKNKYCDYVCRKTPPADSVAQVEDEPIHFDVPDLMVYNNANGTQSFIEPESGIRMECERYYILSDSGSVYEGTGFATIQDGLKWFSVYEPEVTLNIPVFDFNKKVWKGDGITDPSLVLGEHLYMYWMAEQDKVEGVHVIGGEERVA